MPDAVLPQPSQFAMAWDRHRNMLDCTPIWLGYDNDEMNENIIGESNQYNVAIT